MQGIPARQAQVDILRQRCIICQHAAACTTRVIHCCKTLGYQTLIPPASADSLSDSQHECNKEYTEVN